MCKVALNLSEHKSWAADTWHGLQLSDLTPFSHPLLIMT